MLSQHLLILPVLLPAALAALSLLLGRRLVLKRGLALLGGGVMLLLSLSLLLWADHGAIQVYRLGGWQPPFGIMLQLDRLSAWMLVLTALLALEVQAYAAISNWDKRGAFFHELFWLQWMGLNGAFLTGDLFNLFVFFELLLIASYGLLVHGDGRARIDAGLRYDLAKASPSLKGWQLALNVQNLTDKIYADCGSEDFCEYGIRRNGTLSLRYRW